MATSISITVIGENNILQSSSFTIQVTTLGLRVVGNSGGVTGANATVFVPASQSGGGQTVYNVAETYSELQGLINAEGLFPQVSKHSTTAAINATATATAAQVATGYITSTSAAATAITLPTGTLLGAALNAAKGAIIDLYIDNTAGANTVTIAVAVNGILSALAAANAGSAGLLTVPSGVTGLACFRIMFSSATAYDFTRIA